MVTIATQGTDTTYVKLQAGRDGERIRLSLELVREKPSGFLDCELLDVKLVDDLDDAVNVACDFEWLSRENLEELNSLGRKDRGFGEAVERWFENTSALMAA